MNVFAPPSNVARTSTVLSTLSLRSAASYCAAGIVRPPIVRSRAWPRIWPEAGAAGTKESLLYALESTLKPGCANWPLRKSGLAGLFGSPLGGPGIGLSSSGSGCDGNTSTPSIVNDSVLPGTTVSFAPSGTPKLRLMTGMPGLPSAVGVSDFGSTSCVQFLPPPVCGANFSSGISMRSVMPFASLERIVDLAIGSVDGITPPPQLFARLSESSFLEALSAAGPRAARRARSLALFFVPFALERIFVARNVLR